MRLATFNVENLGPGEAEAAPLEARIAALRPQLLRLKADVLCLQEVNASEEGKHGPRTLAALDALIEGTDYAGFHRAATGGERGKAYDRHNLVTLSRWPIVEAREHHHDRVDPPRFRVSSAEPPMEDAEPVSWDRPILTARIDLPEGPPLHVLNLHLRAPLAAHIDGQKTGPFSWKSVAGWAEGYYLAVLKRSGQALEARLLAEDILADEPEARIAVCGDLNADLQDMPLQILAGDLENTGSGALAGHVLTPLERQLPDWRRFSVIHAGRKTMLDHILVSRALLSAFRDIEVHNEALGDELAAYAGVEASPESYHAPLVAAFQL